MIAGRGQFADDVVHKYALRAFFVRSPHAAANILSINTSEALKMPGVVAVLTADDLRAAGVKDYSVPAKLAHIDGSFSVETPRTLLVRNRVRFLAEPVAMVIAESEAMAADAAESVQIEYQQTEAIIDPFTAANEDAPQLWDDRPGNLAFHWRRGDLGGVETALKNAHHVTRLKSSVSRVSAMPMEPRAALAYPGEDGRPVLRVAHQSPHNLRNMLCAQFGLERGALRVIAGDVGGSFGMKSGLLREETLVFWAAMHLNRPVRWAAGRSEAFLSDEQARDVHVTSELGLDKDGKFTALRVRYDVNVGAYMSGRSGAPIGNFGGIAGVYTTPLIVGEAVGRFTNTQPTSPYRGAGRPDATFVIERIIDVAAEEMGIDAAELRRRNLIPPEAMPYQTPFVFKYDCGEFERNMDRALQLVDYSTFDQRRERSKAIGKLRGIGIANPIEVAAGPYARPGTDYATIKAHPDGTVTLFSGAMSVGQGLDTALSTLVSQRLGLPLERINFVMGDTDQLANGKGNGGSAALTLCGTAIQIGVDQLLKNALKIAADELEVSPLDLEFGSGEFRVVGSDHVISLGEIARIAEAIPDQDSAGLAGSGQFALSHPTFPNGCHICEVEVDPETGLVEMVNYVSVEDVGKVLNPMLVEGQIHGGVAQGIGQALLEEIRFGDDGQMLTGSFMDYAMPRASDLCNITSENLETPTELNPLGVKGVGEAGTVGGLAATMNAICNALAQAGVRHLDMPATPFRVWEALNEAKMKY
ncbi:xanthine dehydrogenase family protein molybdopterin-binding subunit [Corticibacterium sp. UT-5YL-CI-8]|nr:xanthine dehydrogenase family protein molybdopterin-binding subunit [Tianweitania sp. UT-5YL-CI-8]